MIKNIENSSVEIKINEEKYNSFNAAFGFPTEWIVPKTITWNPSISLYSQDTCIVSPELALAHELVHASQFIDVTGKYWHFNGYSSKKDRERWGGPEEKNAVLRANVIARELGYPSRNSYMLNSYPDYLYIQRVKR